MTETTGRRRLTCHHEAGHLLARWYFGHFTDRATVLTIEEVCAGEGLTDRQGRKVSDVEGAVDGYDIFSPSQDRRHRAHFVKELDSKHEMVCDFDSSAEIQLIEYLAGAYAEAQFTDDDVFDILMTGAERDEAQALNIVERLCDSEPTKTKMLQLAHKRTAALIGSVKARQALSVMAEALFERGEIDGSELEAMCAAVFGATPRFGCWRDHWPPTLRQLRAGYVPTVPA